MKVQKPKRKYNGHELYGSTTLVSDNNFSDARARAPFNSHREREYCMQKRKIKSKQFAEAQVSKYHYTYRRGSLPSYTDRKHFGSHGRRKSNDVSICVEMSNRQFIYKRSQRYLVNRSQLNISKNEKNIVQTQRRLSWKHAVGITGLDRALSPNKIKYIWMIAFAACTVVSVYLSGICCYQYGFGNPSTTAKFETRLQMRLPRILICPTEIASRNPVTEFYNNKYKEKFKTENVDDWKIVFSELLRLDNINMTSLWNLYEISKDNLIITPKCSVSRSDLDCAKNIEVEDIANAGGRCVSVLIKGYINIFGSLTRYNISLLAPSRINWLPAHLHNRHFTLSQDENPRYTELDFGALSAPIIRATYCAEAIEIRNVNWTVSPCEASDKVEMCIQNCIEKYLYSKVQCRLPFMTKMNLKDCESPESFYQSFLISEQAMLKKQNCTKNCPRKCKEDLILVTRKLISYQQGLNAMDFFFKDNKVLIIEEYQQYTFNDLLANLGGTLGFFLDLKFRKSENKQRFQSRKPSKLNSNFPNISIAGIQILFDKKASPLRKMFWTISYIILIVICVYQICESTILFMYGDRDVLLLAERNFSIHFPALTICPFQPYKHWHNVLLYKETFQFEFNSTKPINDIPLSDVMRLTDVNFLEFWNNSGVDEEMIEKFDVGCRKSFGLSQYDTNNKTSTYINTVNGKCLSLNLEFPLRFRGSGTGVCLFLRYLPATTARYTLCILVHNQEDDIRTLDPHHCIPIEKWTLGQVAIYLRKREFLNTIQQPCSDPSFVAKCQSECYDSLMNQRSTCRLPFMRNTTLKPCDNATAFNQTMEAAFNIMRNYKGKWCNCPRKCQEYIYDAQINSVKLNLPLNLISFAVPLNVFLITREYNRVNFSIFFASLTGFLGLYFGLSILHILELVELLWKISVSFCRK